MSEEEVEYECLACGARIRLSQIRDRDRIESKVGIKVRCDCGSRILRKVRSPMAKKIEAI